MRLYQDRLRSGDSLFISSKEYDGSELLEMLELFTGKIFIYMHVTALDGQYLLFPTSMCSDDGTDNKIRFFVRPAQ